MGFNQYNFGQHLPCQNSMLLRQVPLKKFSIFFCVYLWFKPRTPDFSSGGYFVYLSGTVLAIFVEGHLSEIPMKYE